MKFLFILGLFFAQWACAQQPEIAKNETTPEKVVAVPKKEVKTNAQQEKASINWMTVNEAMEAQKNDPKKIMIDFYTTWCGPCKLLNKNTFGNKDVAEYVNENFYAVKFNAEGNEAVTFKGKEFSNPNYKETKGRGYPHQFSQAFQVRAYPTVVFLDEDLNYISPVKGYVDAKGIEPTLKVIGSDAYKNIKTKEEFQTWMDTTFKATFK